MPSMKLFYMAVGLVFEFIRIYAGILLLLLLLILIPVNFLTAEWLKEKD